MIVGKSVTPLIILLLFSSFFLSHHHDSKHLTILESKESSDFYTKITLDQENFESDFFYSKLFINSSPTLGRSSKNLGLTIDTDSENNIVIGGGTTEANFPMLNPYNGTFGGDQDGFITKMTEFGEIIWSTYIGGAKEDVVTSIAIDNDDNVIVTGYTDSPFFPTTDGVLQENYGGNRDIFLTKYNSQGIMMWSTYFGGDMREGVYNFEGEGRNSVVIDSQNNIIIGGTTGSSNLVRLNAYQSDYGGGTSDAFLAKFNTSGQLEWSTYFGGDLADHNADISVDSQDSLILVGVTNSADFPVINAHDSTLANGDTNAFVAKFNSSGNLAWGTHQGGDGIVPGQIAGITRNKASAIAIDSSDQIIVAGSTILFDNEITDDAYQMTLKGTEDVYISKYSPDGSLIYGSYFGDGQSNQVFGIDIDSDDNYLINTGSAYDETILTNGYFSFEDEPTPFAHNFRDPRMIKFNSTNSLQWITDYMSPSQYEGVLDITMDQLGRILTVGYTRSAKLPGLETTVELKGDSPVLQIIKLDPLFDNDSDGLLNYEEFHYKSDPHNSDTDGDGLTDRDEVKLHSSDPNNADTDSDGLLDKFEIEHQFKPYSNDTDRDEIPDLWEWENGLDATYSLDSIEDFDSDGLSNIDEYNFGTDPNNSDTDGDGMKDGYEVDHNLDPLIDDSKGDRDGDFLPNKFEHDNGLNPNNPIETTFTVLLVILSISAFTFYFIRLNRLNQLAQEQGYESHNQKSETQDRGFTSLDQRNEAESQMFKSKNAQSILHIAKHETVDRMIENWKSQLVAVQDIMNTINLQDIQDIINLTTSPINLNKVEIGYNDILNELNQFQQGFDHIIVLQESISKLPLIDDELPFTGFTKENLSEFQTQFSSELNSLNEVIQGLSQILEIRKKWFIPWQPLLTLIQMTQDGLPIELTKIAEVIQCPEDQAENLLKLLLEENTLIGNYDNAKRVYTKGTNISQYIQTMLETMANFGE